MRATTGRWTPPPAGQPHALPSQPAGLPGMAAHRARRAAGLTPNASESSGAGLAPYQYLSAPVYSLATAGPDGQSPTLNLLTYASPVSLEPRTYALGLYHGTLSRENFLATGRGALQVGARRAGVRPAAGGALSWMHLTAWTLVAADPRGAACRAFRASWQAERARPGQAGEWRSAAVPAPPRLPPRAPRDLTPRALDARRRRWRRAGSRFEHWTAGCACWTTATA
jgi:hypothetical protein